MLTTGAWRVLASQVKDVDVERYNRMRRERRIAAIVWQLTESRPRVVKAGTRQFEADVDAELRARLGVVMAALGAVEAKLAALG